MEIHVILSSVLTSLRERCKEHFVPLKIRSPLKTLSENGYQREADNFKEQTQNFYAKCIAYLEKWAKPMDEFKPFQWMLLTDFELKFDDIIPCLEYLQ